MKRYPLRAWPLRTAVCAFAVTAAACVGATGAARADDSAACPNSVEAPYSVHLTALTGPNGADLTVGVAVDAASKCPVPDTLKKIQLKTFAADGSVASTRNITDVAAPSGAVTLALGNVPRDRRVEADVLVQTDATHRTFVARGATRTLLRPDLVVEQIVAPKQALVGEAVEAAAVIKERNGDVGVTGTVAISAAPGGTKPFEVGPGGTVTVSFAGLAFDSAVPVEISFHITDGVPAETDVSNNSRTATIDVTEHVLPAEKIVLFPSLGGYGAQFNGHLYAPITPMPPGGYADVEAKVKALDPQLVRIFYNENWEENRDNTHPEWPENLESFIRVCQLAQETGATINVTFQTYAWARTHAETSMGTFAKVLDDLVRVHGCTNVRWVTIANEPNNAGITLDQYNALYRALNSQLVVRGLREQIRLMAGDLVEGTSPRDHVTWMKWIGENMGDVVDAYSEHIYWWYDRPVRLEYRLRNVYDLVAHVLPEAQRKPTYLMEYGIRGYDTCGTKPTFANRYYSPDCTEMWRTNIAAFQQFWFNVEAAQLGFAGTSKWDAYWAVYDRTSEKAQLHWMTGTAAEGYPLMPTYNAMSLLYHTTERGWQVFRVAPWDESDSTYPGYDRTNDQLEQELVAFGGPGGELTVIGLDTHGQSLNVLSTDAPVPYSVGGLPANTTFNLAVWNATGDGTNSIAEPVTTNAAGVARFTVPLQSAFSLTTVPVS